MDRRAFLGQAGMVSLASLSQFSFRSYPRTNQHTGTPGFRPWLFFDLWSLDHWSNCSLVQAKPEYLPGLSFEDSTLQEDGPGKPNVFYDSRHKVWRMLYNLG